MITRTMHYFDEMDFQKLFWTIKKEYQPYDSDKTLEDHWNEHYDYLQGEGEIEEANCINLFQMEDLLTDVFYERPGEKSPEREYVIEKIGDYIVQFGG